MIFPKSIYKKIEKAFYTKLFNACGYNANKTLIEQLANEVDVHDEIDAEMKKATKLLIRKIFQTTDSVLKMEHKSTNMFLYNQYNKWGKCFDLYELFSILSLKFASRYNQRVNSLKAGIDNKVKFRFVAIKELHGRACQIFAEILCLIKNGYADGAYARWRTLYEIMIVASFIKEEGEIAAKAFIDASFNEAKDYMWAKKVKQFEKFKRVTFKDIENTCNYNKGWLREYKTACKAVHASAEGTFCRLANREATGTILVGRSDYGVDVPATHACTTLSIINGEFLTIIPDFNTLVELYCLTVLRKSVVKAFNDAEKEIFGGSNKCKVTKINPALI